MMFDNDNYEKDYKTIGEITKELGLINKKTGSLQTHTIRFWETQFKQIRPKIRAGKRRYYSKNNIQNQTIGGKKFKFLSHGQADNLYYWRSDRNWQEKSGSKYIWTGRKNTDWHDVDMVVIKDPIRKDKLKSYSIK